MSKKSAYITLIFCLFNILLTQILPKGGRRSEISRLFLGERQFREGRREVYFAIAAVK